MKFKGIIYKISNSDRCYYGSTTQPLKRRIQQHTAHYTQYQKYKDIEDKTNVKRVSYLTAFEILKVEGHKCEIIEEVEDESNDELKKKLFERETYYVENFPCVNKFIPPSSLSSSDFYYKYRKEKDLEYKRTHKEQTNQTSRKRYAEKKDEINAYRRDRSIEKVICEFCKKEISRGGIWKHKKRIHSLMA